MDTNTLAKAINFITESKYKQLMDNEQKSNNLFRVLKTGLNNKIKSNCRDSYMYLITNKLLTEEDNEDSLFGFHFNNITKDNLDTANKFEDCVKDLSLDITIYLDNMNKRQENLDNMFLNCKTECVDNQTGLEGKADMVINCLENCYNEVVKSHNEFTNEYIKVLNSYIEKFK
jgi:hypothetical protein